MFSMYFDIFHKCTSFIEAMAPFVKRTQGPIWFTNEFPSKSPENAEEVNQIWHAYLSPCFLPLRLSSCNDKNQFAVSKYFPSYYSRQFGLCQLRPAPVSLYKEDYVPTDERAYQRMFKNSYYRDLIFEPVEFQPKFSCTKKFQNWWGEYYTRASKGKTDVEILNTVYSALPSPITEKTKSPAAVSKQKVTKAALKQKKPAARTTPRTKTITTITKNIETQSVPTSTKRKLNTSPVQRVKPHGKEQAISLSSEDTDSEDDVPKSRKRPQPNSQTRAKGIIIQESQEQTTTGLHKSTDQPQAKKAKLKETPKTAFTSKSTTTPAVIAETAIPEPPKETDDNAPLVEMLEKEINEAERRGKEPATAPHGNVADETAAVENEARVPENVSRHFDNEAMDVEEGNDAPMINIEVNVEQSKEQSSNGAEDEDESAAANEDESQEMIEVETQGQTSTKESTSSAMSDQELSMLKKTNPLAAIKHLRSLSSSSSAMPSSASTTSLTSAYQESTEELLQQLKAKVLEDNLLAKIEKNPSESFAIKSIIQKLFKCRPSAELIRFLVEFGPIFETFALQIGKRSELSTLKNQEDARHQETTNSIKVSEAKLDELETHTTKEDQTLAELDSKIQRYEEDIKILHTKLANAKSWKSRIQERMKIPKSQLDLEAVAALQLYDEAQRQQTNISRLEDDLYLVESSIAVSVEVLDRLKLTLQKL